MPLPMYDLNTSFVRTITVALKETKQRERLNLETSDRADVGPRDTKCTTTNEDGSAC